MSNSHDHFCLSRRLLLRPRVLEVSPTQAVLGLATPLALHLAVAPPKGALLRCHFGRRVRAPQGAVVLSTSKFEEDTVMNVTLHLCSVMFSRTVVLGQGLLHLFFLLQGEGIDTFLHSECRALRLHVNFCTCHVWPKQVGFLSRLCSGPLSPLSLANGGCGGTCGASTAGGFGAN